MYISSGAKCSNLHNLCTVPGSGSRFRFLYRCIVVSLYRFLVAAPFYVLSGFIQLQLSLQLYKAIFSYNKLLNIVENDDVLVSLVKPERKIFSQKCEVCLPDHNLLYSQADLSLVPERESFRHYW
jgi:hypothetical protein